jgi:hypothetical protein
VKVGMRSLGVQDRLAELDATQDGRQFRGPLPQTIGVNPVVGSLGCSRGSSRALQTGQGMPGAPQWQARGEGKQSEGRSLCRSQTQ